MSTDDIDPGDIMIYVLEGIQVEVVRVNAIGFHRYCDIRLPSGQEVANVPDYYLEPAGSGPHRSVADQIQSDLSRRYANKRDIDQDAPTERLRREGRGEVGR